MFEAITNGENRKRKIEKKKKKKSSLIGRFSSLLLLFFLAPFRLHCIFRDRCGHIIGPDYQDGLLIDHIPVFHDHDGKFNFYDAGRFGLLQRRCPVNSDI
jgi:hypothetical protein